MVEFTEELEDAIEAEESGLLEVIAERADPDDRRILEAVVRDESSDERYRVRALYALGNWTEQQDEIVETIESAYSDLSERERFTAIDALGRLGTPEARRAIIDHRDAESPDIRRQVVNALSRIGDEASREELSALLEEEEVDFVRESAQRQLKRLKGGKDKSE